MSHTNPYRLWFNVEKIVEVARRLPNIRLHTVIDAEFDNSYSTIIIGSGGR